jgi:hypothetical protein
MLPLDLEVFGRAAGWQRLPPHVADRHFERTATDRAFPGAILPAMSPRGVYWYGAVITPADWRLLQPLLLAYAGPTVTRFTGQTMDLDSSIPAEDLLRLAGVCAMARLVPGPGREEFTASALDRLYQALQLRPPTKRAPREQTPRVLAKLDMCIAAGDRTGAEDLFKLLRDELRVDALNLHFIQVRLLSSFRAWVELADAEWFADLCQARKPSVVAQLMLEALWHARLAELSDNPVKLAHEYREYIQSLARPLLAQISDATDEFVQRMRTLDTSEVPAALPAEAAAQSLLDLAADAPSNLHLAKARSAIEALPAQARDTLLNSGAGQQAVAETGPLDVPLPTSWFAWLEALPDPRFENAVSVADEGVTQWPAAQMTTPQADSLAEALLRVGLADNLSSRRLVQSLPALVRWAKEDPSYPRPALAGTYEALLQLFDLIERRGSAERDAAADLFEAILRLGLSKEGYRRLLGDFGKLIEEGAGLASVYWLIDVASAVLEHPAPDTNTRLILLNRILDSFQGLLSSLSPGQRAAYRLIASGAQWPELPEPLEPVVAAKLRSLEGQSIAIYTLTESSGRQAEKALRNLVPSLKIELAHDHVASPRLVRLARDSDIFVLATASAKHAATDCIAANRRKRAPPLYASGRGFSSIVRAVEEFALSQREFQ